MIIASPVTVTAVPDTSMSPFKTESAAPAPNSTSPVNVAPDKVTAASVINNVPPNTKSVSDVAFVTAEPEIITSPKKVTPSKVAADSSKASSAILAFLNEESLSASNVTPALRSTPSTSALVSFNTPEPFALRPILASVTPVRVFEPSIPSIVSVVAGANSISKTVEAALTVKAALVVNVVTPSSAVPTPSTKLPLKVKPLSVDTELSTVTS